MSQVTRQHEGERENTTPQWWQTELFDHIPVAVYTPPADPTEQIEQWLASKHTTVWAHHNVSPEGNVRKAAEWFMAEMMSFVAFQTTQVFK